MRINYVLVDFENVQPKNLSLLEKHASSVKILVFVGANQSKLPFEVIEPLQRLGTNAQYVKMGGSGTNALDFHIAFYIGKLATEQPNSYFHIISKDKGFDPLVQHLKTEYKVCIKRSSELCEIPFLQISSVGSNEDRLSTITQFLKRRGNARPRKEKTLSNSINSLFQRTLPEKELTNVINLLVSKGHVSIEANSGAVTYHPPIVA